MHSLIPHPRDVHSTGPAPIVSSTLFPPVDWQGPRRPEEFGPAPYPGPRPAGSFQILDGRVHGVRPDADLGWCCRDSGRVVDAAGRVLVLAYGSNLDPRKLARRLPDEPVLALRCAVFDHAAAWCNARRYNGDVVATLVEEPGRVEIHAVLALTSSQLEIMDAWEGTPSIYERRPLETRIALENGTDVADVTAYFGTDHRRPSLRRDGRPFLVAEHPYADIDQLVPAA